MERFISRFMTLFGYRAATNEDDMEGPGPNSRLIPFNSTDEEATFSRNKISTAKYNVFTFIPKFLFEQFRRYANIFFLCIGLLQQIPGVSPTGKYVTIGPFCVVLLITAIKEIMEDLKRHNEDKKVNSSECEVLDSQGDFVKKQWKEIKVGNIVRVKSEKFFPADLILLSSSEPNGICYIETASLDGETNLKIRSSHNITKELTSSKDLCKFEGHIVAEGPNRQLYEFQGNLVKGSDKAVPVGPNQILLRGSRLRNTQWIYGFVVYTGHESKLLMNSTKAPLKRSTLDKETNTQIVFLGCILVALALISAGFNELMQSNGNDIISYVGEPTGTAGLGFGWQFLTFFILYNNLIPISLQVTLEMVKVVQASFINNDETMHHVDENLGVDTYALARTSNLNEELGQIKYVFSDKTGTLTMNVMEYKKCSIGGTIYELDKPEHGSPGPDLIFDLNKGGDTSSVIEEFLVTLAVCHTVIPEVDDQGQIYYNAASPDEKALVTAGAEYGFVFVARTPESVTIRTPWEEERIYEILNVIEFTSTRKRMSVVVRTPSGEIKLLCKGADNVILERLGTSPSQRKDFDITILHLEKFAKEGLRTLCLGMANIPKVKYDAWNAAMQEASTAMSNREAKVDAVAEQMEMELTLIGSSAIEDKLQDQVPETIAKLLEANIHVWMLTGDKQETAINIAKSCRLHGENMGMIIINVTNHEEAKDEIEENLAHFRNNGLVGKTNDVTLILDGKSLNYTILPDIRKDFIDLCTSCKAVVCCRVSPIQKAEMVEMVREHTKAISLAIGDGANDVAMIQKADVGVGISGNEGLQAANSADFSIGQFRFLTQLLFVHGAWNYSRISKVILYSFYKNITLYIIELWFAIYNYWSGQVLYERWTIGMYNLFFTSLPPVALGVMDRTCSAATREKYPSLYLASQSSQMFNHKQFWKWILIALYHSILLFWIPQAAMSTGVVWDNGRTDGYLVLGNTVYTLVVITTCLKAGLEMDAWTIYSHFSIWGSIMLWFIFLVVYSVFWPTLSLAANMRGMFMHLVTSYVFWFCMLMVPVITLLADFCQRAVMTTIFSSETDRIRIAEILDSEVSNYVEGARYMPNESSSLLKNMKNTFSRSKKKQKEQEDMEMNAKRGYAFSQEEGGAVSQTEYIRSYDTTTRSRSSLPRVSGGSMTPVSSGSVHHL